MSPQVEEPSSELSSSIRLSQDPEFGLTAVLEEEEEEEEEEEDEEEEELCQ